jgi:hypothetical protein
MLAGRNLSRVFISLSVVLYVRISRIYLIRNKSKESRQYSHLGIHTAAFLPGLQTRSEQAYFSSESPCGTRAP